MKRGAFGANPFLLGTQPTEQLECGAEKVGSDQKDIVECETHIVPASRWVVWHHAKRNQSKKNRQTPIDEEEPLPAPQRHEPIHTKKGVGYETARGTSCTKKKWKTCAYSCSIVIHMIRGVS